MPNQHHRRSHHDDDGVDVDDELGAFVIVSREPGQLADVISDAVADEVMVADDSDLSPEEAALHLDPDA
jgi:hypothetical protein